jgi:phage terminase small subunit
MKQNLILQQPKPLNPRQERFAEFVAGGMAATVAYGKAGYSNTGRNAEGNASALMEKHGVKQRIAELRKRAAAKAEFTRDDMVQWLVGALKTPVGEIDQNHRLAQELTTDELVVEKKGTKTIKRRVKSVGKIECARLLCDMMGWKAPEKREIDLGCSSLDSVRERAKVVVSALARQFEPRD